MRMDHAIDTHIWSADVDFVKIPNLTNDIHRHYFPVTEVLLTQSNLLDAH
jgi:hypothetical protein